MSGISLPAGGSGSSGGSGGTSSVARYSQTVTSGTAGGAFTSGARRVRPLTQEDYDPDGIGSLSTNQVTLQAGSYRVFAWAIAHSIDNHVAYWTSVSGDVIDIIGTTGKTFTQVHNPSVVKGIFTLTQETVFELQNRCVNTRGTDGFGEPAGFGDDETYAFVEIEKVG